MASSSSKEQHDEDRPDYLIPQNVNANHMDGDSFMDDDLDDVIDSMPYLDREEEDDLDNVIGSMPYLEPEEEVDFIDPITSFEPGEDGGVTNLASSADPQDEFATIRCRRPLGRNYQHPSTKTMTRPPFIGTWRHSCDQRITWNSCAFNQFIKWPKTQIVAVVGDDRIKCYELPPCEPDVRNCFNMKINFFAGTKNVLYQVAWCKENSGYKLVTGGETGKLYVIDFEETRIERALIGMGGTVTDIRVHPTISTLIAVGCEDKAAYVFDIRSTTAIFIIGSHRVNRDKVLTVEWTPDGNNLITAGIDHRIYLWNLSEETTKSHMERCLSDLDSGIPIRKCDLHENNKRLMNARKIFDFDDHTMFINSIIYSIKRLHYDTVDCVRVLPIDPSDVTKFHVLSKGCGHESAVFQWKFGTTERRTEFVGPGEPRSCFVKLMEKSVAGGDMWFPKFGVDPKGKWLVTTGSEGYVQFHDLKQERKDCYEVHAVLHTWPKTMARQVDFCDGGHIIFIVGDRGLMCRMDKTRKSMENPKHIWQKLPKKY